mmetsp:Transcript_39961/g.127096  ORF Transcript_39961/g.127096 Transcript_39961/m.127096 type:complete len:437 (-) Transcript_39961:116-1426(-)
MVGMIIAGPFADIFGRKRGLLLSLVLICLSSCLHAVLPLSTPVWVILMLRIISGISGAMAIPTGITLAVESSPQESRLRLVFGVSFLGALGYLVEALGVEWFMPHFGEESTDNWRGLCLFIGIPALLSIPTVVRLVESPTFLAVNGRWAECSATLDTISRWNERPRRQQALPRRTSEIWRSLSCSETRGPTLRSLAAAYLGILVLLILIDASRSFFTSGSAYLCKDLFELTRLNNAMSPTTLNVIASLSPLVGLIIGERLVFMGVRTIMFACGFLSAAALVALAFGPIRSTSWLLLTLVLVYKLCYGPMGTCVSLMKVEAFPTEFRATAFSAICVAGKLLCAVGPTLVEALKQEESASSWTSQNLAIYLVSLASASVLSGLLSLQVPAACGGDGGVLRDFSKVTLDSHAKGEADGSVEAFTRAQEATPNYGSVKAA